MKPLATLAGALAEFTGSTACRVRVPSLHAEDLKRHHPLGPVDVGNVVAYE
jgi:hypothetical protein